MIRIRFKGQGESGEWFSGLLAISQGHQGQPEAGHYISNAAGMPWAYKVIPETIEIINRSKVDSRFEFEKKSCPFYDGKCGGTNCELWIEKHNGCARRIQAEATKGQHLNLERAADSLNSIQRTLHSVVEQMRKMRIY